MVRRRDGERGRFCFPLQGWNWRRWGKWENLLFSLTVMKSCVGRIPAGKPLRHADELQSAGGYMCVWKTSNNNEKIKPCEYEKLWSLFDISTHISNIHIYIFCTMNITLVCNLSGLIVASRLCHKYIFHSAIWSAPVSVYFTCHMKMWLTPHVWTRNRIIHLLHFFCKEQFRLSHICSHLICQAEKKWNRS